VPLGPGALIGTSLLSTRTKLRLIGEAFGRSRPPDEDESVATFARAGSATKSSSASSRRWFPVFFAGDAERISVAAAFPTLRASELRHGSIVRGALKSRPAKGEMRPTLCTFQDGMESLPAALAGIPGRRIFWCDTQVQAVRVARAEKSASARGPQFQIESCAAAARNVVGDRVRCHPCDASAAI